jgi:hypothetical protein
MAHPKVTKRLKGKLWHLEDEKLSPIEAKSLAKHLRKTEEKHARITTNCEGRQVWWAR